MNETTEESVTHRLYREHIGTGASDDEVFGYWIFALGAVLGVGGVLLFLLSTSASALREASIVLAAAGLALVFAGPVVRLPLRRRATLLVYAGLAVCGLGILWFVLVFPQDWLVATGVPGVIAVYALGLLLMSAAGVAVPLTTARAEAEAERGALAAEVTKLQTALGETEADEADLATVVRDLRREVLAAERDAEEFAATVGSLQVTLEASGAEAEAAADEAEATRAALIDAEADEADLAARLRALYESQARFELYEDKGGEFRWRLRHRNGNVVASSGEGYTRRHNAQKGMASVRRNALGATVFHVESEAELADADEPFEPVEEQSSQATFETYEDNAGEHRFRLRHDNGNVIADSSEGYASRRNLTRAIERLRAYVGPADYLRFDPTGFEIYEDSSGEFRWRLVHRNGNILADSGEGYSRRRDARRAVDGVRERVGDAEFEVFEDAGGEFRWRLVASNGNIVADSGEGYADESGATDAAERVRESAPDAHVLDVNPAAFEIYEDRGGEFRWRLRHRNGNVLVDSGEGYAERRNVRDAIASVKRNAPAAETEEAQ